MFLANSARGQSLDGGVSPNALPVQHYAVLDLSGAATPAPVILIALDDRHQAAFTTGRSSSPPLVIHTWSQGSIRSSVEVPLHTFDPATGLDSYAALGKLRANGEMLGMISHEWNSPVWPPSPGADHEGVGVFTTQGVFAEYGMPAPFEAHRPPRELTLLSDASNTGFAAWVYSDHCQMGNQVLPCNQMGALTGNGRRSVFFGLSIPANVPDTERYRLVRADFQPYGCNDAGWAVGYDFTWENSKVWDGQGLMDFNLLPDHQWWGFSDQGRILTARYPGEP